jgi:hypothetical protein
MDIVYLARIVSYMTQWKGDNKKEEGENNV